MINKELRKTGIGGSDVGKILGLIKNESAYSLYMEKKGLLEKSNSIQMELGNVLESWVMEKYKGISDKKIIEHPEMMRHSKHDFMIGNLDGISEDGKTVVEIKTARSSYQWGEYGGSNIPLSYICQVSHYMAISGAEEAEVFVFFKDKEEFGLYKLKRDLELEEALIKKESEFWNNHFLADIPPSPIFGNEIKDAYKYGYESQVIAGGEQVDIYQELKCLKQNIKSLEERERFLTCQLQSYMKKNDSLLFGLDEIVTWKNVFSNRLDLESFKKEMPEIYNKYCKKTQSRRFLIK